MSTMPTSVMVTDLQQRIPMNLARSYCMDRLNQAYQWILQQGPFTWETRLTLATVPPGQYGIELTGPLADIDIGKPINVYQASLAGFRVSIPFVPPDKLGLYQEFQTTPIPGVFAAWTIFYNQAGPNYQIVFAPSSAAVMVGTAYAIEYSKIGSSVLVDSPAAFFPTPDQFNSLLMDLAEAEIKRRYNLSGWDSAQQKAQASTMMIADQYRSSKMFQQGLQEEGKDAQEAQLSRAGG